MIRYVSTRGSAPALSFEDAVLAGLAPDGGLYVPDKLPYFAPNDLAGMAALPYPALACRILAPFTEGTLTHAELADLVEESYREFRHPAIAPLVQTGPNQFVLELFHGPTLAFKDFALQFLGRLLDHILTKRGEHATILGATSGDTGSAAIAGCRGRENLKIFILHPFERTSEVQRRQMTTVADANVHNIAVRGTFDDCQALVKSLFTDADFRTKHKLAAVNSINWARILAQVVYYFYAGMSLGAPGRSVSFCVPTGNFGDIFAGYLAKRMGLPVNRLIIATNSNDILARTLATGEYSTGAVTHTLSPSMDIQVSSNFERLLYVLHGRDGAKMAALMRQFGKQGKLALSAAALVKLRAAFDAHTADDAQTSATIARMWHDCGYLLDPHTAVGVAAARAVMGDAPGHPVVTLATAHPAKFPDAVKAATGHAPPLPEALAGLLGGEERYMVLENNVNAIKEAIERA